MEEQYNLRLSRKCYYVCLVLLAAGGIAYLILSILDIPVTKIYPYPCSLYSLFGLYCPGCGGTRAVEYLLQGDFVKSFFYHPVVPYTAVLVGCYVISHTLNIFSKGKIKAMMFRPAYLYVMIAIIVIQCVIKNVFVIMNGTHLI